MDETRLPSLTALRAFDAAARGGSFSAAARRLNVTHAAIAQQVRGLEQDLGLPLVLRAGRGIALTEEGALLARALDDGFGTIRAAIAGLRAGRDAALRVTLTPAFAQQWLTPRLGAFWQRHPDVALSLHPEKRIVDLFADRMDIAIRYGDGNWPGLAVEMLTRPGHIVVAAPDLAARIEGTGPDALARLPWIVEDDWPEQTAWMRRHGIDPDAVRATRLPADMALAAVRAGLGLHVEHRALVESDLAEGRLVVVLADDGDPEDLGYWIVTRPGPARPAIRTFTRWLKSVA